MSSRTHEPFPPATASIWRRIDRAAVERLLDHDEKPFTDDEIYLRDASFALHVFDALRNIMPSTGRSLGSGSAESRIDPKEALRRLELHEQLHQSIQHALSTRRGHSLGKRDAPILLRVADQLDLGDIEIRLLEYMALIASDPKLAAAFSMANDFRAVGEVLELSPVEVLDLASGDSSLFEEGILELETGRLAGTGLQRDIEIAPETVKALWGRPLQAEEFFRIDGTALGDVLLKTPQYEAATFREEDSRGVSTEEADDEQRSENSTGRSGSTEPLGGPDESLPPVEGVKPSPDTSSGDRSDNPGPDGPHRDKPFTVEEFLDLSDEPASPTQPGTGAHEPQQEVGEEGIRPYTSDLDYWEDQFDRIETLLERAEIDEDGFLRHDYGEESEATRRRRLTAELERAKRRCEHRLAATRSRGEWLPRLERLSDERDLSSFEKNLLVLLVAAHEAPRIQEKIGRVSSIGAGDVLQLFSSGLEERIRNRQYFYRDAQLVSDGIIQVDSHFGELSNSSVTLDPRMLDFLLGLETEKAQLVDGSQLYHPSVELSQVILPDKQKDRIVRTVKNYGAFQEARSAIGFDDIVTYGRGMVLLFYGPSGTGKTMMANALANHLEKRLLLVNFPSLGHNSSEVLQFLFREARIQDAVLFFDECEGIFRERDTMLLTEIERHDGLIILATNRPQHLDDAMHRRITAAEPFRKPDPILRQRIWNMHIPERAHLGEEVNLRSLAQRYELTGGLIKNAVLAGISEAVARDDEELILKHADLESGAKRQLKGHLRMSEFDRKVVPQAGFDAIVLPTDLQNRLSNIVKTERASRVLFSQWGFDRSAAQYVRGTSVLLYGPPGTGKTMAAKAIAYELGRPIRLVQPAELFSCWVGETPKRIEAIFDEASQNNAVLLFDEADAFFAGRTSVNSSTDRYSNADVNVLLRRIEDFAGVAILTSNLEDNLDDALRRRLQYVLHVPAPDADLRVQLWKMMIPDQLPLDSEVNLSRLAADFALTGAGIRNALYRAAARAAGRANGESSVRRDDLRQAAASEETKEGSTNGPIGFDPDQT